MGPPGAVDREFVYIVLLVLLFFFFLLLPPPPPSSSSSSSSFFFFFKQTNKQNKTKRQGPQRPLPTYNWRDHCLLTTPGTTEKRKEQAEQASIFVDFQQFSTIFNDLQ